ncbi:hypothetical protein LCGC14_0196060 [marine sediment metagenome]|uniref:Uncharacterized protein n=1 Tax=marine sediment metagenome TaxID=412755 RepID=A0A0F9XNL1_9ZZZZ
MDEINTIINAISVKCGLTPQHSETLSKWVPIGLELYGLKTTPINIGCIYYMVTHDLIDDRLYSHKGRQYRTVTQQKIAKAVGCTIQTINTNYKKILHSKPDSVWLEYKTRMNL